MIYGFRLTTSLSLQSGDLVQEQPSAIPSNPHAVKLRLSAQMSSGLSRGSFTHGHTRRVIINCSIRHSSLLATLWPQSNLIDSFRTANSAFRIPHGYINPKKSQIFPSTLQLMRNKESVDGGDGAALWEPFGPFPTAIMSSSADEIRPAAAEGPF